MTTPIVSSLGQPPKPNEKRAAAAVSYAAGRARDWERVAAFLADHPEIAARASMGSPPDLVLCPVTTIADPDAFMSSAAQACVDAGGRAEQYQGGKFGGVNLCFGKVHIQVYADVDKVFSRRVVGSVEKIEYTPNFAIPARPSVDAEVVANAFRLQEEQATDDLTREQIGQLIAEQAEAGS